MVKRGSSTFSAAAVARSGLALGRTVGKTLALEAEVSRLRHHISVLSRRLHLSALESEALCRELDALHSVALLSREGEVLKPLLLFVRRWLMKWQCTPRWLCLLRLRWHPSGRMWRRWR